MMQKFFSVVNLSSQRIVELTNYRNKRDFFESITFHAGIKAGSYAGNRHLHNYFSTRPLV